MSTHKFQRFCHDNPQKSIDDQIKIIIGYNINNSCSSQIYKYPSSDLKDNSIYKSQLLMVSSDNVVKKPENQIDKKIKKAEEDLILKKQEKSKTQIGQKAGYIKSCVGWFCGSNDTPELSRLEAMEFKRVSS